jgi:nuclear pore complex protein Nup205
MGAEKECEEIDRTQLQTAVIRFHRRRELVLICIRMIMKQGLDSGESEEPVVEFMQNAALLIVGVDPGTTNFAPGHHFWSKCLKSMEAIETWLLMIAERMQSAQVVGQVPLPGFVETMTLQHKSLTRQHENLAAICTHMIKPGLANLDNFKVLLERLKRIDRHDLITIHYVPVVIRLANWVAQDGNVGLTEARGLHASLIAGRDSDNWVLRNFHAASLVWWLAEYSGRYVDPDTQRADLPAVDFEQEANVRSEAFLKALDDGAFHFMLSISRDVRPTRWYDPTKTSMISSLLQDAAVLPPDSEQPEDFFKEMVMEQMQTFVDSFITNMPDTLRKLKVEEDDQRRRLQMSFQRTTGEQPFHLERFLVVVAYAFDGSQEAAVDFWGDKESNLYGFLQWAAKRQPTPRIAMFCEMLRALSTGEENAEAAHSFLVEESNISQGKIRRTSSLSYTHIFNELIEFQKDIHEPKKSIQGGLYNPPSQNPVDQIVEPESANMLESYLRLLAHLARQSPVARKWMLNHSDYNLTGVYFGLCVDKVESFIRAAAFDALAALLIDKDVLRAGNFWTLFVDWTISGFHVGLNKSNAIDTIPRDEFWITLAADPNEAIAFVRLLQSLMEPYPESEGLNDSLPFPESLGMTRRMLGIDPFIDFAMERAFADRCADLQDPVQRNVLRWTCLRFIIVCLTTFNENLVAFANKTSLDVDSIIDASSLETYVTLHPFARVMEWLFSDKVLKSLFAASHQNVDEVDTSPSDSPLVQSLMSCIEVMDLVMKLQATYLDIVQPVVRQRASFHGKSVANLSLASFEDAVLNNLQLVVDLGLYCGTGHQTLIIASLQLLEKLASSRKLAISPAGFGQRTGRSKIVGILEKDNEAERIGRCFSNLMQFSEDELEAGPEATGYIVKLRILDFLSSCLAAVSARPTIAHILLGFSCEGSSVRIVEDSLWAQGKSLFHGILLLAALYPDHDGMAFLSWRSDIKSRCWDILQKLWRSPLTSAIVMDELRLNELLFSQAPKLHVIDLDTAWDGLTLAQGYEQQTDGRLSEFFCGSPSSALQDFLHHRAIFLDYESRELRSALKEGMATMASRIQSVLMGSTPVYGEDPIPTATVFDLFDFIEFPIPDRIVPENHKLLAGTNLSICQEEKKGVAVYVLPLLEQLFLLKMKQWKRDGTLQPEDDLQDATDMLALFTDYNRRAHLAHYQKEILRSWVQLVTVTVQGCDFEPSARTSFIMQTLQVILPKLEVAYTDDIFVALQLASLAEALTQKIDFDSSVLGQSSMGDFANDRLSQLFRAALVGMYCAVSTPELREYCYQICFRYIHGTFGKTTKGSPLGSHTLSTIKSCGSHLLEVICDDAYSGQGTCKVSALLLLGTLVAVATRQESKYILESFVSLNFIGVLVDTIKHIPDELKVAVAPQVPLLLSYYDAALSLLLRVCQTKLGAAYVLNAGLFHAVRESRIFGVDPDIGLGKHLVHL